MSGVVRCGDDSGEVPGVALRLCLLPQKWAAADVDGEHGESWKNVFDGNEKATGSGDERRKGTEVDDASVPCAARLDVGI